jgi:hypothetical protein
MIEAAADAARCIKQSERLRHLASGASSGGGRPKDICGSVGFRLDGRNGVSEASWPEAALRGCFTGRKHATLF